MSFNLKIRKASNARSTFNLSFPHLQSAEFMQNNVVFSRFTVPTDHFKISPAFEARCAALVNPSFVDTRYFMRAFYVPHSVVWHRFNDWVTGNPTYLNGQLVSNDVPYFDDTNLTNLFAFSTDLAVQVNADSGWDSSTYQTMIANTDISHKYDFVVLLGDNKYYGYTFTNKGRYTYKLLVSLGYKFVFTLNTSESQRYNALPLLSYFRIFLDYFVPSVKHLTSSCYRILSYYYNFTGSNSNMFYDADDRPQMLKDALHEVSHCFYPSSYLTSSWQTPSQPLQNSGSSIDSDSSLNDAFTQIISSTGYDSINTEDQVQGQFALTGPSALNPWAQRNAQRVVDWLMRSRFVGSEQLLNILSRFGVKPKTPLAHTSRLIGTYEQPLMVQDVNALSDTFEQVSTTESKGAKLGEYAGKMFTQARNAKDFEVNADDYGCVIITCMIAPNNIFYYQGTEREIMKTKPMQFFQPEFDSVGFEILNSRELMSGFYLPSSGTIAVPLGAGYVPRYSSYKVSSALVSGDFAVPTLNTGSDSFHHFRALYKYGKGRISNTVRPNLVVPNTGNKDDINDQVIQAITPYSAQTALLTTSYDKNQFNRIFNVASDSIDHIQTMYYFHVTASRPMRSIADSLITLDGDNDKIDVSKKTIDNV